MSSHEFNEWMAYYRIEPFGELVADQRHGVHLATVVNMKLPAKSKARQPEDFITWRAAQGAADEPELLDDPIAQAALIKAAVFGIKS